jgi:3-methyladenine DNA glycosylase AlkD
MIKEFRKEIDEINRPEKVESFQRFFKTDKGEYGEGDVFVGLSVPESRDFAKRYEGFSIDEVKELLDSEVHEMRLIGLMILVSKYEKNPKERKGIFDFYLENADRVNNWDLVDLSAPKIVGDFVYHNKEKRPRLETLARSNHLWRKRIAIVSTLYLIKKNELKETLKISKILLKDKHDLIHKAVGWMLREVGKKDEHLLKKFLADNYSEIPRTTLRYSIERFPKEERKKYLKGEFDEF